MNNDAKDTVSKVDYVEEDLSALGQARDVMKALPKYLSGKKIYAKNNPTLVRFAKEFQDSLRSFFEVEDELVLTVEQYMMKWRDQIIYDNEKREDSIAFLLYKDGVGEISVRSSVTAEELETFVDLIKNEMHSFGTGEDVVTQFWRADFNNIHYRVLDEYLVGEFGEGRKDDSSGATSPLENADHPDLPSFADKGRVIVKASDSIDSIGAYLESLVDQAVPDGTPSEKEEYYQNLMDSFFMVSSEELKMCQEEMSEEKKTDKLVSFTREILEFTLLKDPPAVRDVSNIVDCICDYLVAEGDMKTLVTAYTTLKDFIDTHTISDQQTAFFEKLENKFTSTELLLSLGQRVKKWDKQAEAVFAFFRSTGKRAVPTICTLLEDFEGIKVHRAACELLIDIAPDDIPQIIERLNMDNRQIAQDVIFFIRQMHQGEALHPLVRQLMYYPDPRVRQEVIEFLSAVASHDAVLLLVKLLDDQDTSIRLKALKEIEKIESPIIKNKIVSIAFDKEETKRGLDEQERVFTVLGRLLGEEALPRIQQMLEKKNFLGFGKSQSKETKLLAIRALEQVPCNESIALLTKLGSDSSDLVRTKAHRALEHLQTPKQNQTQGSGDTIQ